MFISKGLLRVARLAVALTLLGFLVFAVDWGAARQHLAGIEWLPAVSGMAGLSAQFVISPWKWQWALRLHGLNFKLPYLIRANGIGFFFNNFLPSAIGGDAYRVMSTWPKEGYRSRAISAVVIERIVGLIALLAIGNAGALSMLDTSGAAAAFIVASMLCAVIGIVIIVAIRMGTLDWLAKRLRNSSVLDAVAHNVDFLRRGGRRWLPLIAISVLFQLIAVANIYLLFRSLGAPVGFAACTVITAAAGVATSLPISINGLGVVEGSFAGTAVALGVSYEIAFTVAVLIRLMVLPATLVFGLMYGFGGGTGPELLKKRPDPELIPPRS